MNDLIGNNYESTDEQLKAKKWMKIIGVILILLFLICIGLIVLMYYIQALQLKITVDGKENIELRDVLIFDNGKVYIPIRDFSEYMEYESSNGDYQQDKYTEDITKCYVKNNSEVATFSLDSNKIYKTLLDGNNDYEYYEIDEPIKMINNQLYTTIDGAKIAFNISMTYDEKNNQVTIYTLPYLVTYWANQFSNSAIVGDSSNFSNQKALLYNRIIVKNANNYYGVYDLSGNEVLGTKYASIKFIESTKEFIVTTPENKMGIISYDATTKISPTYDEIKQIDKDSGLYLVTNNKKQGVINNSGNIIIYLEYDQIGIDASKYNNNIKNQYLIYDNCIPVKINNQWGIFDKTGKQILAVEYEDLGCSVGAGTSGTQTTSANNVLLVPEYEGIVVKNDGLYGLIDSKGKQLLPIALKSIYSTTSAGEETYYMVYNDQIMNVITYIETYIKPSTVSNSINKNDTNTTNDTNTVDNEQTANTANDN